MEQPVTTNKARELSIAYHEAGHVAAHLVFQIPFEEVTIKSSGFYEGRVYSKEVWIPPKNVDPGALRYHRYTNNLVTLKLAGPAARARHKGLNTADPADDTDRIHALTIIDQLFTVEEEASRQGFIESKTQEAFEFITHKDTWNLITLLAHELVKNKTLSQAQCQAIFLKHYPHSYP
jgi:hypothetical protein